jgi:hypothetical protein
LRIHLLPTPGVMPLAEVRASTEITTYGVAQRGKVFIRLAVGPHSRTRQVRPLVGNRVWREI